MPRKSRMSLTSNYYHIMVQGINKSYIFNETKNKYIYLKYLTRFLKEQNVILLAYCMMDNHAHFVVYTDNVLNIGNSMHMCNLIFSNYYNQINDRVGVIFRNRYKSEPIYDEKYLAQCIKYVHNNPVKAHIVEEPRKYLMSSYNELFSNNKAKYVNKEHLIKIFGKDFYNVINNADPRIFRDIDDNRSYYYSCIEDCISNFLKKEKVHLLRIFESKRCLFQLFDFINFDCNVDMKYILEYFGISKSTWYYMNKGRLDNPLDLKEVSP